MLSASRIALVNIKKGTVRKVSSITKTSAITFSRPTVLQCLWKKKKKNMERKLQAQKYDRISWEGIKLDEDSLTAENGKRQVFYIHFICL